MTIKKGRKDIELPQVNSVFFTNRYYDEFDVFIKNILLFYYFFIFLFIHVENSFLIELR